MSSGEDIYTKAILDTNKAVVEIADFLLLIEGLDTKDLKTLLEKLAVVQANLMTVSIFIGNLKRDAINLHWSNQELRAQNKILW